jgi:hypothetical protein
MTLFIDLLNCETTTHKIAQVELDKMDIDRRCESDDFQYMNDMDTPFIFTEITAEFEMTVNGWKYVGLIVDKDFL